MLTLLGAVLTASLAGSLHCAGMCGPFAAFAVGAGPLQARVHWLVYAAYHGGRLTTYVLLGAVCGIIGAAVDFSGGLLGVQRGAAILAGSMMVAIGIVTLLRWAGARIPEMGAPGFLGAALQRGQTFARSLPPASRAGLIGALSTLLPCGWLYAFAITAAATGDPRWGAAVMAAFWAGTVPVLLFIGIGTQGLTSMLRGRLAVLPALVILVVGLMTVAGRLAVPASAYERIRASRSAEPTSAASEVESLDASSMPCCHSKP